MESHDSSDLHRYFRNPDNLLNRHVDALIQDAVRVTCLENIAILGNLADVDLGVILHLGNRVDGLSETLSDGH